MPLSNWGSIWLNVGALAGEAVGTYFLTLVGLGVYAVSAATVIGPGFGFAFAVLSLMFVLYVVSGSHFNPGITAAKLVGWLSGLQSRDYFGSGHVVADAVFAALYIGMQMAGAVLAVLSLRFVDHSDMLESVFVSMPNGNLANHAAAAFFLAWLLNTFHIFVFLHVTDFRLGIATKLATGPLVYASALGASIIISVYFGTGTLLNFAVDLAIATTVEDQVTTRLWISVTAQIVGAATAVLLSYGLSYLSRFRELKAVVPADPDHSRSNLLSSVMNRVPVKADDPLLPALKKTAEDTVMVVPDVVRTTAGVVERGAQELEGFLTRTATF